MGQALTESIREEHCLRQRTRTRVAFLHPTAMISLFLMSCGGDDRTIESTVRYEPPVEHRIVVETVVDLPFDEAIALELALAEFTEGWPENKAAVKAMIDENADEIRACGGKTKFECFKDMK